MYTYIYIYIYDVELPGGALRSRRGWAAYCARPCVSGPARKLIKNPRPIRKGKSPEITRFGPSQLLFSEVRNSRRQRRSPRIYRPGTPNCVDSFLLRESGMRPPTKGPNRCLPSGYSKTGTRIRNVVKRSRGSYPSSVCKSTVGTKMLSNLSGNLDENT